MLQIRGNFDQALNLARELTQHLPITIVNSINPDRIEGQKTGAFEIVDVLGEAPDILSIPVGNAGNITAYWRGFTQYHFAKRCQVLPKMWGFQAAGAAPIVLGHPVENPETIATAIRIGNPASWVSRPGSNPRVAGRHPRGDRRRNSRRLSLPRALRISLLRTGVRRVRGGDC